MSTNGTSTKKYRFSTTQNTKLTVEEWRSTVKYDRVLKINRICEEAMAELGYLPGDNAEQLRNLSFSFVGQFPFPKIVTL